MQALVDLKMNLSKCKPLTEKAIEPLIKALGNLKSLINLDLNFAECEFGD